MGDDSFHPGSLGTVCRERITCGCIRGPTPRLDSTADGTAGAPPCRARKCRAILRFYTWRPRWSPI